MGTEPASETSYSFLTYIMDNFQRKYSYDDTKFPALDLTSGSHPSHYILFSHFKRRAHFTILR
jgi:hypothetical protein